MRPHNRKVYISLLLTPSTENWGLADKPAMIAAKTEPKLEEIADSGIVHDSIDDYKFSFVGDPKKRAYILSIHQKDTKGQVIIYALNKTRSSDRVSVGDAQGYLQALQYTFVEKQISLSSFYHDHKGKTLNLAKLMEQDLVLDHFVSMNYAMASLKPYRNAPDHAIPPQ